MKSLTIEDIYRIEHDLIGEVSVWERVTSREAEKLAYYNDGIHDMTSRIINEMQGVKNT